jgi:hypothetical protein
MSVVPHQRVGSSDAVDMRQSPAADISGMSSSQGFNIWLQCDTPGGECRATVERVWCYVCTSWSSAAPQGGHAGHTDVGLASGH